MLRLAVAGALLTGAALVAPLAPPVTAPVDQAFVVSLPTAKAAAALLRLHPTVVQFCAPCGDAAPTVLAVGRVDVEVWDDDPRFWVVTVNGDGVDLAYTYVPLRGTTDAVNLALLAHDGDVTGVPAVVAVPD